MRREKLRRTCEEIRREFAIASLPFIFLRGLPFAERYFDVPEDRLSGDVDLLVRQEDVPIAFEILQALDFRYRKSNTAFREAQAAFVAQTEFVRERCGVVIDLNWKLTGNGNMGHITKDMDEVWKRTTRANGVERVLAPEDELLHVIRHEAHGHLFEGALLRACTDVSQICARHEQNFDWQYFDYQTYRCGMQRGLNMFTRFLRIIDPLELTRIHSRFTEKDPVTRRPLYVDFVIVPMSSQCENRPNKLSAPAALNRQILTRFMMADGLRSLARIYRMILLPPTSLLVLMGDEHDTLPHWIRRIRTTVGYTIVTLPSLLIGVFRTIVLVQQFLVKPRNDKPPEIESG